MVDHASPIPIDSHLRAGQHGNALRPLAIALYLGPVMLALLWFIARTGGGRVSSLDSPHERRVSNSLI